MVDISKCLTSNEKAALEEIKRRVSAQFDVRHYILFGSKVRGDAQPDSDIDLLIITGRKLEHRERHIISDILTDVNLDFDTLYSFITVEEQEWKSKLYSFYPLHKNVTREGIAV
ncbi:MAG: nucleotidyltransferase domain-containing protein [Chitinivibrionales bacterium]|nr:nucleotidyltransferase domain-containing protein [Chitinivibrionales bacterium]